MVIMDNTYELLRELRHKIDKYHLGYLEMEESPEKMEYRNKLEDYIREYLCIAPHIEKFAFQATADILERSASSKIDFSGYKAATGWNAIQLYAGNLLSQPWRKEYRRIKMYSGFYKHQIEANLVGAEVMFETMGYKHAGDGILILEGPICPDRVQSVSKDCLIAYVECQILKMMWEEVTTMSSNITWNDLLEFRRMYACTPEQAIKNFRYFQRQDQTRSIPPYVLKSPQSPILPLHQSFPPLTNQHYISMPSPQQVPYICNGGPCCSNNFQPYAGMPNAYNTFLPYAQSNLVKPPFVPNTNGYLYTNGYPPLSTYNHPVPTGQLIEFESHNGLSYDMVDGRSQKFKQYPDVHKNKTNNNHHDRETEKSDLHLEDEDWDYVYRDLEKTGYTKDLGERGDILSPTSRQNAVKDARKVKMTNLDEAVNNLSVNERPLRVNDSLERDKKRIEPKQRERRYSQSSSYENVSPNEMKMAKSMQKLNSSQSTSSKVKSLPREKVNVNGESKSKTLDGRNKMKEEKVKNKNDSTHWECPHCTYLNDLKSNVCEVCCKSQSKIDEHPIEVGGSECPKCTLVNSKNAVTCQACGADLKNSPTYI